LESQGYFQKTTLLIYLTKAIDMMIRSETPKILKEEKTEEIR